MTLVSEFSSMVVCTGSVQVCKWYGFSGLDQRLHPVCKTLEYWLAVLFFRELGYLMFEAIKGDHLVEKVQVELYDVFHIHVSDPF